MSCLRKRSSLVKNIERLPEPLIEHILSFCHDDGISDLDDLEVTFKNFGKIFCFGSIFMIMAYITGSLVTGHYFSASIILLNILIGYFIVTLIIVFLSFLKLIIFGEKTCNEGTHISPLLPI